MRKVLFLMAVAAFCLNCGSTTGTNTATINKSNAAAPANTTTAQTNKPAAPANTTAPANTNAASNSSTASNPDLDFTLINKTGYDLKEVFVGKSGTGEWAKEDEILKGKNFANGNTLEVKFNPKATAEYWDVKVTWADGSGGEEWTKLKLTEIEKITLVYDKAKDETSAITE